MQLKVTIRIHSVNLTFLQNEDAHIRYINQTEIVKCVNESICLIFSNKPNSNLNNNAHEHKK